MGVSWGSPVVYHLAEKASQWRDGKNKSDLKGTVSTRKEKKIGFKNWAKIIWLN